MWEYNLKKICFFSFGRKQTTHVCAFNVYLIHHVNTTVIGGRQLQKQRHLFNEIYLNLTSVYKSKCLIKVKQHCVMIFFLVVFIETYGEASRTVSSFIQHVAA